MNVWVFSFWFREMSEQYFQGGCGMEADYWNENTGEMH